MFEFDPEKSAANLAKHGIDFETAQLIWQDIGRVVISAKSDTEPRFAVIGTIERKLWTVFATMRDDAVRIISARRSRESEVKIYEVQND